VILINAVFSFWQEFKTDRAIEALKDMLPSYATAIRSGEPVRVLSDELVPGDIIQLEEGDAIPADGQLFETAELRVDNSAFSGESEPMYKLNARARNERQFLWIEIPNLVFAGASVISGSGKAVVTATVMNTEIGQIARLTQEIKVTPLQRDPGHLGSGRPFFHPVVAIGPLGSDLGCRSMKLTVACTRRNGIRRLLSFRRRAPGGGRALRDQR